MTQAEFDKRLGETLLQQLAFGLQHGLVMHVELSLRNLEQLLLVGPDNLPNDPGEVIIHEVFTLPENYKLLQRTANVACRLLELRKAVEYVDRY